MPPRVSDLVLDSKLETSLVQDGAIHTYEEVASGRRRISRQERWTRKKLLGEGGFGRVWLESCTHGESKGDLRAVKMMRKQRSSHHAIDYNRELEAVAKFSHRKYERCFVKSFGWFEGDDYLYIAMEYLPHGDLHAYLYSVQSRLSPDDAQQVTYQILEGLDFMHTNGFAHRDIKPANILIESCPPQNWWVKLSDFGISKREEEGHGPSTIKGTRGFMAPELQGFRDPSRENAPIDFQAADMWAVGEIAFRLLSGESAFLNPREFAIYSTGHDDRLKSKLQSSGNEIAADFIVKLMIVDPEVRSTTSVALEHPWMSPLQSIIESTSQVALGSNGFSQAPLEEAVRTEGPPHLSTEASARWSDISNTGDGIRVDNASPEVSAIPIKSSGEKNVLSVQDRDNPAYGTSSQVPAAHKPQLQPGSNGEGSQIEKNARIQGTTDPRPPNAMLTDSLEPANPVRLDKERLNEIDWQKWISMSRKERTKARKNGEEEPWLSYRRGLETEARSPEDLSETDRRSEYSVSSKEGDPALEFAGKPRQSLRSEKGEQLRLGPEEQEDPAASTPDRSNISDLDAALDSLEKTKKFSGLAAALDQLPERSKGHEKEDRSWSISQILERDLTWRGFSDGHKDAVNAIAFAPDGKTFASGSTDTTVKLWNSASGKLLHTMKGHNRGVFAVSFSPSGELLASASDDRTLRLWNQRSGSCSKTFTVLDSTAWVRATAFGPDNVTLASAGARHEIRLWNTTSVRAGYQTLTGHNSPIQCLAYALNSMVLASASMDRTVKLWDGRSGAEPLQTIQAHHDIINSVAFAPDGRTLASASDDETVKVWDIRAAASPVHTLKAHFRRVLSVTFAPHGDRLVSGLRGSTVKIWSLSKGAVVQTLLGHTKDVHGVAFAPDGSMLASVSMDQRIIKWATNAGLGPDPLPYSGLPGFSYGVHAREVSKAE